MKKSFWLVVLVLIGLTVADSALAEWAAIAYSPSTGRYGTASNRGSSQEAVKSALNACSESDCRLIVADNNACIAIAAGYQAITAGSTALYESMPRYNAKQRALGDCENRTVSCNLICSVCSSE